MKVWQRPPEGYFIFEDGYLAYKINNESTRKMHEIIEAIVKQNQDFCCIRKGSYGDDPPTWFVMGFADLSKKTYDLLRPTQQIDAIKPDLAEKRMAQIDRIWEHLTKEIEKLAVTDMRPVS